MFYAFSETCHLLNIHKLFGTTLILNEHFPSEQPLIAVVFPPFFLTCRHRALLLICHSCYERRAKGVSNRASSFTLYINDFDIVWNYLSMSQKFTLPQTPLSSSTVHASINLIEIWTATWQHPINRSKCKFMHAGFSNHLHSNSMCGFSMSRCDFGVTIDI